MKVPARRSRIAVAVSLALAVATAGLATAVTFRLTDPADTVGVLDVREVKFTHPKGEPPAWSVITAASWKVGPLWDRGYVFVQLDTMWSEAADYYALIRSDGRSMRGELFRIRQDHGDTAIAGLTVWRKARDSVSVKVPLKLMEFGPTRTYYRWWVVTSLTNEKCPASCIDRAPNEGSVQQWRPGMSPAPSPPPSSVAPASG